MAIIVKFLNVKWKIYGWKKFARFWVPFHFSLGAPFPVQGTRFRAILPPKCMK